MLYLPIKRSWIVSCFAQRLYFGCALANLYLFAVLVATFAALTESGEPSLSVSPAAVLLFKILLWPGVLGTGILAVAMWYFWFTFDQSRWAKRASWFLVLALGLALGPVIYYFFAYRRSPVLDACFDPGARGTSVGSQD